MSELSQIREANRLLKIRIYNAELKQKIAAAQAVPAQQPPGYSGESLWGHPETLAGQTIPQEPQAPITQEPLTGIQSSIPETNPVPAMDMPMAPGPAFEDVNMPQAPADITTGQTIPSEIDPATQRFPQELGEDKFQYQNRIGQSIMDEGLTPRQAARRDAGTTDPNVFKNLLQEIFPGTYYRAMEMSGLAGVLDQFDVDMHSPEAGVWDPKVRYAHEYGQVLAEELAKKEGQQPTPIPDSPVMTTAEPDVPEDYYFPPQQHPDLLKQTGPDDARIDAPGDQPSTDYKEPTKLENYKETAKDYVEKLPIKEGLEATGKIIRELGWIAPAFVLQDMGISKLSRIIKAPKSIQQIRDFEKKIKPIRQKLKNADKSTLLKLEEAIGTGYKNEGTELYKAVQLQLGPDTKKLLDTWAKREKISQEIIHSWPVSVQKFVNAEFAASGGTPTWEDYSTAAAWVTGLKVGTAAYKNLAPKVKEFFRKKSKEVTPFIETKKQYQERQKSKAETTPAPTPVEEAPAITGTNVKPTPPVKPKTKTPAYPGTAAKGKEAELIGRLGTPKTPAVQTEIIKKPQHPWEYQDSNQELIVHGKNTDLKFEGPETAVWKKGNHFRNVAEGSGDIFREFSLNKKPSLSYLKEKIDRAQEFLDKEIKGRMHPEDSFNAAKEHNPAKIEAMIEQWKSQPTTNSNQELAKDYNLALLQGELRKAKTLLGKIANLSTEKAPEKVQPPKSKVASPEAEGAPATQQELDFEGEPVKAKPAQEIKADYNTQDFAWTKRILEQKGNKNPTDAEVLKAMEKRVPNTPRPKSGKGKQGDYDQKWKTEIIKQNEHLLRGIAEGDPEANMKAVKLKDLPDVIYLGEGTRLTRVETRGQQHFKAIQTAKEKISKLLAKNKKNKTAKRTESLKKLRAEIKDRNQKIKDTSGTDTIEYRNYDFKDEIYDMKLIAGEKGKVWIDKAQDLKGGDLYVDGEMVFEPLPDFPPADSDSKKVKKLFKKTENLEEAGFITTQGDLLSLGKNRELQHTDIPEGIDSFLNQGNIRISPDSPLIEIRAPLTVTQKSQLKKYIQHYQNIAEPTTEIEVEINIPEKFKDYTTYDIEEEATTIINIITKQTSPSIVEEQLDLFKQELKNIKPVPFKKLPVQTQKASLKAEAFLKRATKNRLDLEASQIMAALQKEGKADLVGVKVTDPELMAAVQILRHPLWEIAWLIFSKNGKVKMVRGVSSRTPGVSNVKPDEFETAQDYLNWIEKTMKDNGYDEVRALHNHPSGDPLPSDQDVVITKYTFAKIKGFKGHYIIDHGKWSTIDAEGNVTPGSFDVSNMKDPWVRKSQIKLDDIPALMQYATTMNVPEKNVGIIHIGRNYKLQGVENLRLSLLKGDGQAFKDELTEAMQVMGSLTPIAALSPNNFELLAPKLMKLRVFEDILSSDGTSYRIQMKENWLRSREWRTFKGETVQEQRDLFETPEPPKPPEPNKIAKVLMGAKKFFRDERDITPKDALPIYDRWVKEIQVRTFKLAKLVNDIKRMGTKTEREAVPFIIEKTSVPEKLKRADIEKVLANPDSNKKIMAMAAKAEKYFAESWDYMVINRPEMSADAIENYVTHLWDIPKNKVSDVVSWFSTRNPQLMKRMITTIYDGVEELGLTPKTLDIGEILSIHGQNAIRTTENQVLLDGIKALQDKEGVKLIQPASKAPNEWKIIDHPALMKATWVGEGTVEKKITLPRETIIQTIEKIKTISRSGGATVDGDVSGPMKKLEKVVQGALESRGMTPGESKAYLGRLKAAYAGKNVSDAGGERTTETVKRKVNTILDEIEQNVTVKYPKIMQLPVKVHPDLEPLMQAVFSSPWNPVGKTGFIVTAWEGLNAILKQTSLAVSFFHHIALGEAAVATMGPLKTAQIALNLKGIWNALKKDEYAMFMEKYDTAKEAIGAGLVLGANLDVQKQLVDKIIDTSADWAGKKVGSPFGKLLKGIGWGKEKWDQALWDYYHNNLKLYAYETLLARELVNASVPIKARVKQKVGKPWKPIKADLTALTPKQIKLIREQVAAMVNDTFGGQNLLKQMKDPHFQRVLRSALLSPDWLKSTLKQAGSILSIGTVNRGEPGQSKMRMGMGWKFWARAAIYFGGANLMLNYLMTRKDDMEEKDIPWKDAKGKWMWENDPGHETHVFWGRGLSGEKLYLRTGKQFREGPEFFWDSQANEWSPYTATKRKIGGKMAPVPQIVSVLTTGKTLSEYEVRELRKKEGWEKVRAQVKFLSTTWVPFSFSALRDEKMKWSPIMFAFPVSKGMSPYKTRKYLKIALIKENEKFIRLVYNAAIDNNIPDVDRIFKQVVTELETEADAEYKRNLEKADIKEEELEKIETTGEYRTAGKVIKKLIKQKNAIERQKNKGNLLRQLDRYEKRKSKLESKLDPKDKAEKIQKLKDKLKENDIK